MKITKAQADDFLYQDVEDSEKAVSRMVKVPLTQGQFDALVCFVFNLGAGALQKSTLLRKLNRKDYDGACAEFDLWINAGGKPLLGLKRRRDAEQELWNAYDDQEVSPSVEVDAVSRPSFMATPMGKGGAVGLTGGTAMVLDQAIEHGPGVFDLAKQFVMSGPGVIIILMGVALAWLLYCQWRDR
ncbi:lysozyme [Microvirga pudoricolor]|uniref:lysozyme n=1 Tax=Microvirga pudoricolor TaxID=2778729 RepID=UPI00194F2922|nr:lysozyme [Microvirga pudoricolor]MBM6595562.1 lysozyme [Microvirga pudoricolor]